MFYSRSTVYNALYLYSIHHRLQKEVISNFQAGSLRRSASPLEKGGDGTSI